MSVAGASSKNSTIGAAGPQTPSTMPAVYSTPDPACSPHANNSGSSTCSPAIAASPSRSPGASTRTLPGAYRDPNKIHGKALMQTDIDRLSDARVPRSLTEIVTPGRTLKHRSGDILAYFDHTDTSNGPTEAINGHLEHLRGSALGLAKPHPLHHPSTPRNRRIQTPTTPQIMKSPKSSRLSKAMRVRMNSSSLIVFGIVNSASVSLFSQLQSFSLVAGLPRAACQSSFLSKGICVVPKRAWQASSTSSMCAISRRRSGVWFRNHVRLVASSDHLPAKTPVG